MLRVSSIPHEYYSGNYPGTIQYHKKKDELILLGNEAEKMKDTDTRGFVLCEQTKDNLNRIVPYTKRNEPWKIILMMKKENEGDIHIKAALLNTKTDEIALLTSVNKKESLKRPVRTLDSEWFIGHYRMCAPLCFWIELKNRLLY
jgi:hypothetical protein